MKIIRRVGFICITMICILLVGCGANSYKSSESKVDAGNNNDVNYSTSEEYSESNEITTSDVKKDEATSDDGMSETSTYKEDVEKPSTSSNKEVANNRKIIKTVSMSLETQKFENDVNLIENKINSLGGYIESQNVQNLQSHSDRSCTVTARIPADKLDEFVNTVSETGNVVSKDLTTDDVTLNYVDTESRVKVLRAEQERLLALIEKADTMEAIITLESRLTDIRYELESNQSQLRTYDNLVEYSTVNLTISEVYHYTPKPDKEKSTWEKMKSGLQDTLTDMKKSFTDFAIGFVTDLPYIVVLAIVVLIIIILIKIVNNKLSKKVNKNLSNNSNTNIDCNANLNSNDQSKTDNMDDNSR